MEDEFCSMFYFSDGVLNIHAILQDCQKTHIVRPNMLATIYWNISNISSPILFHHLSYDQYIRANQLEEQ